MLTPIYISKLRITMEKIVEESRTLRLGNFMWVLKFQ